MITKTTTTITLVSLNKKTAT